MDAGGGSTVVSTEVAGNDRPVLGSMAARDAGRWRSSPFLRFLTFAVFPIVTRAQGAFLSRVPPTTPAGVGEKGETRRGPAFPSRVDFRANPRRPLMRNDPRTSDLPGKIIDHNDGISTFHISLDIFPGKQRKRERDRQKFSTHLSRSNKFHRRGAF